jgi:hypothetical protein
MSSSNHQIEYMTDSDQKAYAEVHEFPSKCPVCRTSIAPRYLTARKGSTSVASMSESLFLVFQCPANRCRAIFVALYSASFRHGNTYYLKGTDFIQFVAPPQLKDTIKTISPEFCNAFWHSLIAEENGLTSICGAGYRRALEFLVKDYLISQCAGNPEEVEKIKRAFLGTCVKRIGDENLRTTAERAVWLGNDETHYLRKWEEHDLESLKVLIELTMNWIESTELTKKYRDTMPE